MSDTIKSDELEAYDFGSTAAPEGFDPDAAGYEPPPVGEHVFYVEDFEIAENNTFKGKDFGEWVGNQLRPRLTVADGEHKGASIIDFLPLPTPGAPMPKALANRWCNFIRAFGFQPPADAVVPVGFKLHDIKGTRGKAAIIDDTYDGKTRRKVRFFGYSPVNGKKNGKSNGQQTKAPAAQAAPAAAPNLDDL